MTTSDPADHGSTTDRPRPEDPAHETVNRESHPNAGGPEGLEGGMGVSSERTGPFEGIEGTGTVGSARGRTDGEVPTSRATESLDDQEVPDKPDATSPVTEVDRTVGEVQPHPVRNKHEFDPDRNPGH
jgi:hypothetical protein